MSQLLRITWWAAGALLALLSASPALANGDTTGTVSKIYTYEDSRHYALIALSVPPAGTRAACAVTTIYAGAVDLATSSGQAQFALLLTAQALGRQVRVYGVGDIAAPCSLNSPTENVSFVYMIEP